MRDNKYYELLFMCLIVAMCFVDIWEVVEFDWPEREWFDIGLTERSERSHYKTQKQQFIILVVSH